MKKLFLFSVIMFAISVNCTFAQISAVLQHADNNVEQFMGTNGLTLAIDAATDGDFIYLSGGVFLAPPDINKSGLSIFGAGHYPDSTGATGVTMIDGDLRFDICNNFYMEGVFMSEGLIFSNDSSTNQNFTFVRCRIAGEVKSAHIEGYTDMLSFIGCVIEGNFHYQRFSSVHVQNSILDGMQIGSEGNLFTNNVFTYVFINYHSKNNILSNNIFTVEQTNYLMIPENHNMFYNNIFTINPVSDNYYLPDTGASDTLMVDLPILTDRYFNYEHDYHLRQPQIYIGNDGTPVGIYGGTHVYKEGAVPSNPHIQFSNITPQTDGQGQLPVNIRVRAQGGTDE